jgi:hypothetical protein
MPGAAALPKSPAGSPAGPGGGPMMSPGGGAGTKANAVAGLKGIIQSLVRKLADFDVGSKEFMAVDSAIRSLTRAFGKSSGSDMVPAALKQLVATQAKGPMSGAPPPGMMGGGPGAAAPPMMGGVGGGAAGGAGGGAPAEM